MLQDYINQVVLDTDKFPFTEQVLPQCYMDVEKAIQANLDSGNIPQHGECLHFNINVLIIIYIQF